MVLFALVNMYYSSDA